MISVWWKERTARERVLIGVAGGLLLALFAFQVLGGAVFRGHAQAKADHIAAQATWRDVRTGLERLEGSGPATGRPATPGSLRSVVSSSARQLGMTLTRVQPSDDGALAVSIDAVSAPQLYRWLHTLQREHGVQTIRATVRRSERDIVVRASLTLAVEAR